MTAAVTESNFVEELHPRGTGDTGGQFVAGSGSGSGKSKRASAASRTMSWDPKAGRGSGYGRRGGNARVRKLQAALNALGIHDAQGKPLALDGNFGPKTSSAVRALQQRLGLPADGKVTPELLRRVLAMPGAKPKPKPKPVRHREAFAGMASPAVRLMLFARTTEAWDGSKHLRLPKGASGGGRFTAGSAVAAALDTGKPDALEHFGREQLRREAKRRGLTLKRGAPIDEIRDMLHDHHGSSGHKSGDAKKPSGSHEDQVRSAVADLADAPGGWVRLSDVRDKLPHLTRDEQDKALRDMALKVSDTTLVPQENQKEITAADRRAALHLGGEEKHLISIEAPRTATKPRPAVDAHAKALTAATAAGDDPVEAALAHEFPPIVVDAADRERRIAAHLDTLEEPVLIRGRWSVFGDEYPTQDAADQARRRVAERKADEYFQAMETYRQRAIAERRAELERGRR